MSTLLPVPIQFELPNAAWESVEPSTVGVSNAAFLAMRRDTAGGYTPIITVSGDWRTDSATLTQIADESLDVLRTQSGDAELAERTSLGTDEAPAILQSLQAVATIDGTRHDLRQVEVLTELLDVYDHTRRAVVIYTLTCTFSQLPDVGPEFQTFMATVEVVAGDGVKPADGR